MAERPKKTTKREGAARGTNADNAFLAAALDNPETLRRRLVLAITLAPPRARTRERGRRRP